MQQLLIEISHENQIFVEEVCTNKGYTLNSFFELLLNNYKDTNGYTVEASQELKEALEDEKLRTFIPPKKTVVSKQNKKKED